MTKGTGPLSSTSPSSSPLACSQQSRCPSMSVAFVRAAHAQCLTVHRLRGVVTTAAAAAHLVSGREEARSRILNRCSSVAISTNMSLLLRLLLPRRRRWLPLRRGAHVLCLCVRKAELQTTKRVRARSRCALLCLGSNASALVAQQSGKVSNKVCCAAAEQFHLEVNKAFHSATVVGPSAGFFESDVSNLIARRSLGLHLASCILVLLLLHLRCDACTTTHALQGRDHVHGRASALSLGVRARCCRQQQQQIESRVLLVRT